MELNNNKRAELPPNRFAEIQRASEAKSAELRETVDRVQDTTSELRERSEKAGDRSDSIELSAAAKRSVDASEERREARLEELRAAVADGSLFDHDRLARAAERLLTGE